MLHEELVGNNPVLGKYIHALSNLNNNVTIVNKRGKFLLLHDGVNSVLDRDAHAFMEVEGCDRIEFLRSVVMNWALNVVIVLLRRNLKVMRSAFLVLRSTE